MNSERVFNSQARCDIPTGLLEQELSSMPPGVENPGDVDRLKRKPSA